MDSNQITIEGDFFNKRGSIGFLGFARCYGEGCASDEEFLDFMKDLYLSVLTVEPMFNL